MGAIDILDCLTPPPRSLHLGEGTINWPAPLRIHVNAGELDEPATRAVLARHGDVLAESLGWECTFVDDPSLATLTCVLEPTFSEGYVLTTTDGQVTIVAANAEATQWALTTLAQMLPAGTLPHDGSPRTEVALARVAIADAPAFSWRGVHLDVARHFFDVDIVKRVIDLIAALKCNVLHLHLSDDQGWRLDVPAWPKLTEVGAWRASSPLGHESDGLDDHVAHGGFFDSRDIDELVRFAGERFVTIVPEIDLPGHVSAVLAAYPQFANTDGPFEVATRWGIFNDVLNLDDETFEFADEVLSYVGQMFPGPYVHVGGDECPTTQWAASDRVRERMDQLGIDDVELIQSRFTERFVQRVESLPLVDSGPTNESSRRAIAWDEVLATNAPTSTIIAAWRHSSYGADAARRGHDVIMAPMQFTYFDWPQSDDPAEPVALTRPPWPTTLAKVRRFSVIPPGLEPEFHSRILGAQAQLWSEYIATPEHLEYMMFPRLIAFAEAVWRDDPDNDDAFDRRVRAHLERLDARGVNFRRLDQR